jgi:hypothetical protein
MLFPLRRASRFVLVLLGGRLLHSKGGQREHESLLAARTSSDDVLRR